MPNHLSILGIIHTAISILALLAGFIALYQFGRIKIKSLMGKWYLILTFLTCITGLPIMRTGQPTPGHVLAVLVLLLLPLAIYAYSIKLFKNKADYLQTFMMSTTLFFSMVPAINETLTRVPISAPIASGPDSPIIKMSLLLLVVVYLTGTGYQILRIRAFKRANPDTSWS